MNKTSDMSLRQLKRYILVGGFNTIFGYGVFALANWSFKGLGSYSYMLAFFCSSLISLTVAFLGYKWFVFRTCGNYIVEYIRCFAVYSSSMLIGLVGLPILVPILRGLLKKPESASYIAAAVLTVVSVAFSFLGHKNISFRPKPIEEDEHSSSGKPVA